MGMFKALVTSLAACADEGEMAARVDEAMATARTLGKRKRLKKLASLKAFLHTGTLPPPGAGTGRDAVLQLAHGMLQRGMLQPEHVKEGLVTKGADASGRRRFALVLDALRERIGDSVTDTGALLNAVDAQLAAARADGRSKLPRKLLALRSFLCGKRLKPDTEGHKHIKSFAAHLAAAGLLSPERIPAGGPQLPDPLAATVKAIHA